MYYIYTAEDCPRCERQKAEWKRDGIPFTERSSDRLKGGEHADQIDVDGFVALCSNNMQLPAIVYREDE